jgi:hypothetical protein
LPDPVIDALQAGTAVPYEDDLQRLIQAVARTLVETGRPRTDLVEQLANALGWPAVVELVALVDFYCMVSFTRQSGAVKFPGLSWTRR